MAKVVMVVGLGGFLWGYGVGMVFFDKPQVDHVPPGRPHGITVRQLLDREFAASTPRL